MTNLDSFVAAVSGKLQLEWRYRLDETEVIGYRDPVLQWMFQGLGFPRTCWTFGTDQQFCSGTVFILAQEGGELKCYPVIYGSYSYADLTYWVFKKVDIASDGMLTQFAINGGDKVFLQWLREQEVIEREGPKFNPARASKGPDFI